MSNQDNIIRKINALKAKINDSASTPNEVESAIRMVEKLMLEYNISETALGIKTHGVGRHDMPKGKGKQRPAIEVAVTSIANFTETTVLWNADDKHYMFFGTKVDTDYADWLYRLIENSGNQSWKAFRYSQAYTQMVKYENIHGRIVLNQFMKAFMFTIADKLDEMLAQRPKPTGTALVLVKKELIKAFLDDMGGKRSSGGKNALIPDVMAARALRAGIEEANKVRLRQETDHKETLLLEGK